MLGDSTYAEVITTLRRAHSGGRPTPPDGKTGFATSHTRDASTGLDNAFHRNRHPAWARFTSPAPTNPQSCNRYNDIQPNPVNNFDPLGLPMCSCSTASPTSAQAWACNAASNYISPMLNLFVVTYRYQICRPGPIPGSPLACTTVTGTASGSMLGMTSPDLQEAERVYVLGVRTPLPTVDIFNKDSGIFVLSKLGKCIAGLSSGAASKCAPEAYGNSTYLNALASYGILSAQLYNCGPGGAPYLGSAVPIQINTLVQSRVTRAWQDVKSNWATAFATCVVASTNPQPLP
jgi:RHS repeat-associated protein